MAQTRVKETVCKEDRHVADDTGALQSEKRVNRGSRVISKLPRQIYYIVAVYLLFRNKRHL